MTISQNITFRLLLLGYYDSFQLQNFTFRKNPWLWKCIFRRGRISPLPQILINIDDEQRLSFVCIHGRAPAALLSRDWVKTLHWQQCHRKRGVHSAIIAPTALAVSISQHNVIKSRRAGAFYGLAGPEDCCGRKWLYPNKSSSLTVTSNTHYFRKFQLHLLRNLFNALIDDCAFPWIIKSECIDN